MNCNSPEKSEVLAVGALLMDHLLQVKESFLETVPGAKWGMETVNYAQMIKIIDESGAIPLQIAGGSAANTIKGLAGLGRKCAISGKIGKDRVGKRIKNALQEYGVQPLLHYGKNPTGHVACLITPDGKRTCRTYPGASLEMGPENLEPSVFKDMKLVHVEGYTLLCPNLTRKTFEMGKEAGALISFDLASFEIVETYRNLILDLLPYVDILFGNEQEVSALIHCMPKDSAEILKGLCPVSIIMMGSEGCLAINQTEQIKCAAKPVTPIDTTGAGDLFASGFLHAYLAGKSLLECAQLGNFIASEVIQVIGAEIPLDRWRLIMQAVSV